MFKLKRLKSFLKRWSSDQKLQRRQQKSKIEVEMAVFDSKEELGPLSPKDRIRRSVLKEGWLQLSDRVVETDEDIERALVLHFTKAFQKRKQWLRDWFDENLGRVPDEAWPSIDTPCSKEEVQHAVFGIEADKAPGPDGVGARFYQAFWDLVKQDVMEMFHTFFSGTQGIGCLNATFFALIPEKGAVQVGDFRPISLINGSYKLIEKVLANRLKLVIAHMVEENQIAFILGCLLQDGFMVTQEYVSAMHRDKRQGLVIKLDFSKAYDNVDWDFLLKLLQRYGFEPNWIRMVRECISMAKASVLDNGKPCGFFHLNKGIRHGDPLSPLLFVVVTNVFS
ncbi:hypothetical protein QJS10_CPB21g01193 [Acorus calamus]|uniref:Reverse transcriptase domain-containing protein n=1 Tax=Acorus calamus TaxID=4465 RepID=A0AAV9C408_ACOCL|nr:hypothetical protein QJS10_CPB21g01193 [Acorus calamus]